MDGILGRPLTFKDRDQADRFRYETEYWTQPFGCIKIWHPDLAGCFRLAGIGWSCHPADDPKVNALRLFLAGSSGSYPVEKLEWYARGEQATRLACNGVRGALALRPHFMMDEVQWWSYAEGTRSLPLYVPFGTWRSAIGEAKSKQAEGRKLALMLPSPKRKAASRRKQGLKKANAARRGQAREERDRLVEVARRLLRQATAERSGRRGRPAHRARLKVLLEEQGWTVSEHRLKQLVRELGP